MDKLIKSYTANKSSHHIKYVKPRVNRKPIMPNEDLPYFKVTDTEMQESGITAEVFKNFFNQVAQPTATIPDENRKILADAKEAYRHLLQSVYPANLKSNSLKDGPSVSGNDETAAISGVEMGGTVRLDNGNAVDAVIKAFEEGKAPIIPRTEIINECLKEYLLPIVPDHAKIRRIINDMPSKMGITPNDTSYEILAGALQKNGKLKEAVAEFGKVRKISESKAQPLVNTTTILNIFLDGSFTLMFIIQHYLRIKDDKMAWELYDDLRSKQLPSPAITATMIRHLARKDYVERAFLLYKELVQQGMNANEKTHSSLIYAASKRKKYYPIATELWSQMELLGMKKRIYDYNNMLSACNKVADLPTAMGLWERVFSDPELGGPNEHTCTSFLWTIAAAETVSDHISRRPFAYDMNPVMLQSSAWQVYEYAKTSGIAINAFLLNALLAVHVDHGFKEDADRVFWEIFPFHNITPTPSTCEIMFKLHDHLGDVEGVDRVIQVARDLDCLRAMPLEGWRALVRTKALNGLEDEAMSLIHEMISYGYPVFFSDFKHVYIRLTETRPSLAKEFMIICHKDPNSDAPNPFYPWLERSRKVSEMLDEAYGNDAPESATYKSREGPKGDGEAYKKNPFK